MTIRKSVLKKCSTRQAQLNYRPANLVNWRKSPSYLVVCCHHQFAGKNWHWQLSKTITLENYWTCSTSARIWRTWMDFITYMIFLSHCFSWTSLHCWKSCLQTILYSTLLDVWSTTRAELLLNGIECFWRKARTSKKLFPYQTRI